MGAGKFTISSTNPNNGIGGGGCMCSETANPDQEGPYAIFPGTEMDSGLSPHAVLCVGCAEGFIAKAHDDPSNILACGEDDEV